MRDLFYPPWLVQSFERDNASRATYLQYIPWLMWGGTSFACALTNLRQPLFVDVADSYGVAFINESRHPT